MEFIKTNWVLISGAILAILRVVESYMVESKNDKGVTVVGFIKQFFTIG